MELHMSRSSTSGARLHAVEVPLRTGFDTEFEAARYSFLIPARKSLNSTGVVDEFQQRCRIIRRDSSSVRVHAHQRSTPSGGRSTFDCHHYAC
jgi:hypothetical protein